MGYNKSVNFPFVKIFRPLFFKRNERKKNLCVSVCVFLPPVKRSFGGRASSLNFRFRRASASRGRASTALEVCPKSLQRKPNRFKAVLSIIYR